MTDEDKAMKVLTLGFDDIMKIMQEEGCYSRLWSPQETNIWRAEFSYENVIGYAENENYYNVVKLAAFNYFERKMELQEINKCR